MTREEQLACLKDRPCSVCKMRTDKGCISWECVFEQTPDEEKEPCDCISREEVCDYIAEFVNHEYATDRERELVKHIIGGIQHLPSIQPKTDVLDKIMKEIKEIYADIDDVCIKNGLNLARRIINKYKAESEDKG